ncbi:hypothetical protein IHQ71_00395 [Rhizobium sp. TH2]|uniref:hypothetical protein n=1 Tax=Rhizobium sp. TH2 TaxID=2775403 RepID=UPI002156FB81|nr:hypothetical protein [Rhizobium sp. TH2]UVC09133.1 hypothetical protein IHQ71_00395 [Rhizobium sp. TH2]
MENQTEVHSGGSSYDDLAAELFAMVRHAEAAQRVNEMLLAQVFMRFAHSTGDMSGFVKTVLDNIDTDLRHGIAKIDPTDVSQHEWAIEMVEYFGDLKPRLIGMLPKRTH